MYDAHMHMCVCVCARAGRCTYFGYVGTLLACLVGTVSQYGRQARLAIHIL